VRTLAPALLACLLVACSTGVDTRQFADDGVSFRYPKGWHVTRFSTTNSPRRLAVASYALSDEAVEGDCGGYRAVELLPPDGALVLLIDYGSRLRSFPERPAELALSAGAFAEYECFGPSTLFRFRVGDRALQAHVALGRDASDGMRDRALAILESLEVQEPARFEPRAQEEGERVALPLTFPDGTRAELSYPRSLALERYAIRPYSSGALAGVAARDFAIYAGDVDSVLADWNHGTRPGLVAEYRGRDGRLVGLWRVRRAETSVHYLGFQFGRWAVLVYDYVGAGTMTDAGRATWVESFEGRETEDGWLLLESTSPLRLARAGEHAGPELMFSDGPERALELFPGPCPPHRDQTRMVAGKIVSWRGGFANWCLSSSMRIHATGNRRFIGALIRELEVRRVQLAD
jgi:hypothetical protein